LQPLHFLLALLLVAVWGANFVVVHEGLRDIPPITLCLLRMFFSAVPAVFFVRRPALPWSRIALFGIPIFLLQFSFLFVSMANGLSAGLASVCLQLQPFFTIGLAVCFLGERPAGFQIFGALLALVGIGVIALHNGQDVTAAGLLFAVLAAMSWATGNIFARLNGRVDMFAMVIWGCLITVPPLLALSWLIDGSDRMIGAIIGITWVGASAVAYQVILSTLLGYTFWSQLLQRYPTATVAPLTLMVPVAGIGTSALVLGEAVQGWKIAASALVIGGLCVNMFGPRLRVLLRRR
jgi:O-acetylserine/cysteine efflux transporter